MINQEPFWVKILIQLFGSFAGCFFAFILGMATMYINEYRSKKIRIAAMRSLICLLILQLRDVLHEDPKLNGWLKIDIVYQYIDLLKESISPRPEIEELLKIHNQWQRGFYLPDAIKGNDCIFVKEQLQKLANDIKPSLP